MLVKWNSRFGLCDYFSCNLNLEEKNTKLAF